jgi:hypothetical protein
LNETAPVGIEDWKAANRSDKRQQNFRRKKSIKTDEAKYCNNSSLTRSGEETARSRNKTTWSASRGVNKPG